MSWIIRGIVENARPCLVCREPTYTELEGRDLCVQHAQVAIQGGGTSFKVVPLTDAELKEIRARKGGH